MINNLANESRFTSRTYVPKLSEDMATIIRNGDWLVDQHITIASKMLKAQFPSMSAWSI